jgi:hypothetical protein
MKSVPAARDGAHEYFKSMHLDQRLDVSAALKRAIQRNSEVRSFGCRSRIGDGDKFLRSLLTPSSGLEQDACCPTLVALDMHQGDVLCHHSRTVEPSAPRASDRTFRRPTWSPGPVRLTCGIVCQSRLDAPGQDKAGHHSSARDLQSGDVSVRRRVDPCRMVRRAASPVYPPARQRGRARGISTSKLRFIRDTTTGTIAVNTKIGLRPEPVSGRPRCARHDQLTPRSIEPRSLARPDAR